MSTRKLTSPLRIQEMKQRRMRRLKKTQSNGPIVPSTSNVESAGLEDMPIVVRRFIEPWVDTTETDDDFRKLVGLATVAWNAAILPPEKRQSFIDCVGAASLPAASHAIFNEFIQEMIAHKQTYFARDVRFILKYDVKKLGHGDFDLTVMSTKTPPTDS